MQNPNIARCLVQIENCYTYLTKLILKLENTNCGILEASKYLIELDFHNDPCNIGVYIKKRLQQSEILDIVNCSRPEISPRLYSLLHNCQYTSAAVEKSFSLLKKLLTNFHSENVRKYIIILYNSTSRSEEM